jgi:hypothetical protein
MHTKPRETRRHFLKMSLAAAVLTLTGGMSRRLWASELPHLAENDGTAKMLGYVEDATKTKDARFKTGEKCAGCELYTGEPSGFGACQLFPGKAVNADGWCSSYTPKKS